MALIASIHRDPRRARRSRQPACRVNTLLAIHRRLRLQRLVKRTFHQVSSMMPSLAVCGEAVIAYAVQRHAPNLSILDSHCLTTATNH
jgi:hypothetical protein